MNYVNANSSSSGIVNAPARTFIKNFIQLRIELQNNPHKLLEIPCAQIPKWQSLVQFTPPQSVKDKITDLKNNGPFGDFNIQYLDHASGAAINLDYFPVTINQMPTNPQTGNQYTPAQLLNHIRLNINSFVNTNISSFSPSTITGGYNEAQIWNSSNPLGAIIHIDIPTAGDGSVICSQTNSNTWIFTTIEVPWRPSTSNGYDGIHPVSGNRMFGIIQNTDGSYTFFTRGVDRMTDGFESVLMQNTTVFGNNTFENPDLLWNSLRQNVFNFVQNNSGNAMQPIPSDNKIWRPNWNKVRQVLKGEIPITDLGCN